MNSKWKHFISVMWDAFRWDMLQDFGKNLSQHKYFVRNKYQNRKFPITYYNSFCFGCTLTVIANVGIPTTTNIELINWPKTILKQIYVGITVKKKNIYVFIVINSSRFLRIILAFPFSTLAFQSVPTQGFLFYFWKYFLKPR
jgi:hypothetical protein